ncbi:MAG: hypothetical protein K2I93_08730, partial [Oscillospiraceae bacterium]|nr:hypothetical protein [Oscillospiraceae bacterium]
PSDTSEPDPSDTSEPDPSDTQGIDNVKIPDVQAHGGFYFSHDPQAFSAEDLVKNATIKVVDADGNETEEAADLSKFSFKFYQTKELSEDQMAEEPVSPQSAFADETLNATGAYVAQTLYVYYEGKYVSNGMVPVYIGVKGDANLDGTANATDAARVLIYAAEVGGNGKSTLYSKDNKILEEFAYFLADTNGESSDGGATSSVPGQDGKSDLNASDAAQILIYAAIYGGNKKCDWIPEVLKTPYPAYSEEIAKAAGLID